ncbi:MAG TPA: uroporphyrinogen decarboxylase family protein [Armatimonadota bacterium]|jgi:uroporphyrinogen decarboxylase
MISIVPQDAVNTTIPSSRERVLAAVRHQAPDRTPMDFGGTAMSLCTADFLQRMRQTLGYALPEDHDPDGEWVDEAIQRYLGVDLRFVPWQPTRAILRELDPPAYAQAEEARKRRHVDPSIKNPAVKHYFPLAEASIAEIMALPVEMPSSPVYLDWIIRVAKDYRAAGFATTFWVSGGYFEQGCLSRGYDQIAMDLACEPDLVRALFDHFQAAKLPLVDLVIKPLAPYIDIFCFGDDLGLQTGPFMSPALFEELIQPYMATYYQAVHAAAPESHLFHHSCGSVYRLLDGLMAAGVEILNPIQPKAAEMEAERLKEKGRGRLCFHGGMDLQELLPSGTPEEVRAEATRRKAILGDGGGYICAPAHSLPEDVPVENILALFGKG